VLSSNKERRGKGKSRIAREREKAGKR